MAEPTSDPGGDVVRARPVRLRRVAVGIAAVVVVLFVVIAALLGQTSSEGVEFGPGDQIAVLAVQAADGQRAVAAVRALRALYARHAAGEGHGPSTRSHGVT